MPAKYGVDDHRMFVIDMLTSSLIENNLPTITRAATGRLNTTISRAEATHVGRMEDVRVEHF